MNNTKYHVLNNFLIYKKNFQDISSIIKLILAIIDRRVHIFI